MYSQSLMTHARGRNCARFFSSLLLLFAQSAELFERAKAVVPPRATGAMCARRLFRGPDEALASTAAMAGGNCVDDWAAASMATSPRSTLEGASARTRVTSGES